MADDSDKTAQPIGADYAHAAPDQKLAYPDMTPISISVYGRRDYSKTAEVSNKLGRPLTLDEAQKVNMGSQDQ